MIASRRPLPDEFKVISKYTGIPATEQSLPKPAKSAAQFANNRGIDQQGQKFEYFNEKLVRDGKVILDLGTMTPESESPPSWARKWPNLD